MHRPHWSIKLWCTGILVVLSLSTCKHGTKTSPAEVAEESSSEISLVTEGESAEATYSSRGDKLLFVSRARKGHARFQVYEKDLTTGAETRITFQNGNIAYPRYSPKGDWILYSSSTDELKEEVPRLSSMKTLSQAPEHYREPFELYLHSLEGLEISRLTRQPGFDGEARFNADGSVIVFSRVTSSSLQLFTMSRQGSAVRPLRLHKNAAQYVESSKLKAWIEWSEDFKTSRLVLQKGKAKAVEVGSENQATKVDPQFTPDGKWLLWAQQGTSGYFEIWSYEIEAQCLRPLVQATGDRRHPVVSPDLKWLTFTSWRKDRSRIAQVAFEPTSVACVRGS